jgi:hypothetical protein
MTTWRSHVFFSFILLTLFTASIDVAHADDSSDFVDVKVLKVKGRQAIVLYPEGAHPAAGDMLTVTRRLDEEEKEGKNQRGNLIGIDGSLFYLNNSTTSKSTTGLTVTGRYGWNFGNYEYGPIGTLNLASDGSQTVTVGGFADINMVRNSRRQKLVYGFTGDLEIGTVTQSSSSGGASASTVAIFGGGQAKYFVLSNATAVRVDAGLALDSTTTNGTSTSISGLLVKFGLANYF